jgi:hypothetical protein
LFLDDAPRKRESLHFQRVLSTRHIYGSTEYRTPYIKYSLTLDIAFHVLCTGDTEYPGRTLPYRNVIDMLEQAKCRILLYPSSGPWIEVESLGQLAIFVFVFLVGTLKV